MGFAKKVMESGAIFNALMIIGFLGIVWLLIYGNLSGNFGFQQTSSSFFNETINLNATGDTPASAVGTSNPSVASIIMTNATGGEIINSANFTVTGAVFVNATPTYGGQNVNVSYVLTRDSDASVNTENVVSNLTDGTLSFFELFPTILVIAGIVLLITILVGLLFLVISIFNKFSGGGKGSFSK